MVLRADESTIRLVPWAADPTAQVIHDCFHANGEPVATTSRYVLRRVLDLYRDRGWRPVVAPELEFYLVKRNADPDYPLEPPVGRSGQPEWGRQSFGIDVLNEYDPLIDDIYDFCEAQKIELGTLSHEAGAAQLEINLSHGDPLDLADQAFLFKRTVREAAMRHGVYATFMAKPMEDEPGSAMHIHQSVVDAGTGENVFAGQNGAMSPLFRAHIGGLQRYLPAAMSFFAPNVNSYRRITKYLAAPINVQWGVDNRTAGLRVPLAEADATRVENRVAGADANPYLAIAASLACGLIGMTEGIAPTPAIEGKRLLDALRATAQPRRFAPAAARLRAARRGPRRALHRSLRRGQGLRAPGIPASHQLVGTRVPAPKRMNVGTGAAGAPGGARG